MKAYRDNTHSIFSHVFRCPPCPLENLVPRNEFERKLLDFVKNGGMMHDGGGVLKQKLW